MNLYNPKQKQHLSSNKTIFKTQQSNSFQITTNKLSLASLPVKYLL